MEFAPHNLPDAFPISGGEAIWQMDAPITQLHLHDVLEIGYCFSGAGVFAIENKIFPFQQGCVSVINNREFHFAQSVKGTQSEWAWIILDPIRLLGTHVDVPRNLSIASLCGPRFRNILPETHHPEIGLLVREIVSEMRGKAADYQDAVRGLVWSLMVRLHRLPGRVKKKKAALRRQPSEMLRISPALEIIASDYMNPIEIARLAAACHMSLTHFRRTFKRAVGQSPLRYLNHLRVQMACSLLTGSDRTILEISLATGFPTLSSFNRHFKSAANLSPRQWRQKHA